MQNSPLQASVRQPRALIKVGGSVFDATGAVSIDSAPQVMDGWIDWEVDNNTFSQSDTYRVTFAISALPASRDEAWFAQQQEITVEIFAGFPANAELFSTFELKSLIYGKVDEIEFDPAGRTMQISGRDLTSLLIDSKPEEKWQNLTASDAVKRIAARHGLTAVVTATKEKIGTFYQIDNAHLTDQRSEWDFLTSIAQAEQMIVYVSGRELHFEVAPDQTADPYVLEWKPQPFAFDGMRLEFYRRLNLSAGVRVTVKSWNQRSGLVQASFPATVPASAVQYSYNVAHLDAAKAKQKAQSLYAQIIAHEVCLTAELPGDNILGVTSVLRVIGTGTTFDQFYYPDTITRRMSQGEGYTMRLTAKNKSQQTAV